MADHIKVYEEKKKGLPIWAWLIPLLLLLALLAYFLTRHHDAAAVVPVTTTAPATAVAAGQPAASAPYPDLGVIRFATDKADLTDADKATLDRAAAAMQANPNAHMRVEGFTDSTGTDPHNMTLSQQRAYAVGGYLKAKGIAGNRLTGEGFGPAAPIASNDTTAGKADNRRVELFSQQ